MAVMTRTKTERMQDEVRELATERKAVLLAHNYQAPEIQDVADHVGDSLALSRLAASPTVADELASGFSPTSWSAAMEAGWCDALVPEYVRAPDAVPRPATQRPRPPAAP